MFTFSGMATLSVALRAACIAVVSATCSLGYSATSAEAGTYVYTGNTYLTFDKREQNGGQLPGDLSSIPGTFTTAMSINGSFTVTGALSANLSAFDISGLVDSFSFSNGRATLTDAESAISTFQVSTDGVGAISEWSIMVTNIITPLSNGEIGDRIITRTDSAMDQGLKFLCLEEPCAAVSSALGDNETGVTNSNPGTWAQAAVVPVPLSGVLLASGLLGFGFFRRRTVHKAS